MARKPLNEKRAKRIEKLDQEDRGRSKDSFPETGAERQFFYAMDEIAGVGDAKGFILTANEAMARRFGRQVHELVDLCIWDILPPGPAKHRKRQLREVLRTGQPVRFEDENRGTWFENVAYPILDTKGKVIRVAVMARDITERKRMETLLKEKSQLLETILAASPIGIGYVEERELRWVNDAMLKMLGAEDHEEYVGKDAKTIYASEKEYSRVGKVLYKALKSGKEAMTDAKLVRKDGSIFDGQIRMSAPNPSRPLKGAVAAIVDISARKQAEEALREARDELERKVEERTADLTKAREDLLLELERREKATGELLVYQKQLRDLTSQLAITEEKERRRIATYLHDNIGHSLAVAKWKLEALMGLGEDTIRFRKSMGGVLDAITATIEELRKITFEISTPILYELGFTAAVEWLAETFLKANGIRCQIVKGRADAHVSHDVRVILYHAVREIMVNIVKHAKATSAKIVFHVDGNMFVTSVMDNGSGFKSGLEGSDSGATQGFGLFNIRERIDSTGGSVDIESRPGKGACVTLRVPMMKET